MGGKQRLKGHWVSFEVSHCTIGEGHVVKGQLLSIPSSESRIPNPNPSFDVKEGGERLDL